MRCIDPITLKSGVKYQTVPCGKCNYCLESRRNHWSFRVRQELKCAKSAWFLTWTYDESEVPYNEFDEQTLVKSDVQKFLKRLRKANLKAIRREQAKEVLKHRLRSKVAYKPKEWPSVRYYTVGEYGEQFGRPHYHSIMFNLHPAVVNELSGIWAKGFVHVGKVTAASIHYVTGYIVGRKGEWPTKQKPFALISNRSGGLGRNYIPGKIAWHNGDQETGRLYVIQDGCKISMPRYYREKIFSDVRREKLTELQRLEMNKKFFAEYQRLEKIVPDVAGYLQNQLVVNHELKNKQFKKGKKL